MHRRIQKFEQYSVNRKMALEFINAIAEKPLLESKGEEYESILKKIVKDLKLNCELVLVFGTGITLLAPVVERLINNMKLSIDVTPENIVLLTITALSIAYIEEKVIKKEEGCEEDKKESRSLLEELKLRGIGNTIVKKLLNCLKSIVNIFGLVWKHKIGIVETLSELFTYTALFIPTMNAILYIVGKYDLTLDTMAGNFLSIGMGISTSAAKNAISSLVNKLKDKLSNKEVKKIKDEIEIPKIKDVGADTEIITEKK